MILFRDDDDEDELRMFIGQCNDSITPEHGRTNGHFPCFQMWLLESLQKTCANWHCCSGFAFYWPGIISAEMIHRPVKTNPLQQCQFLIVSEVLEYHFQ